MQKNAHLKHEMGVLLFTNQTRKLPMAVTSAMKTSVAMATEIAVVSAAISAVIPIPSAIRIAAAIATITIIATIAIPIAASIVAITTPEPRASPDKGSTAKPLRAIVPVRRTGIGCISVISVRTDWRTVRIRTYADAERNLRMRVRDRYEKD
jgi:hypothetical protein